MIVQISFFRNISCYLIEFAYPAAPNVLSSKYKSKLHTVPIYYLNDTIPLDKRSSPLRYFDGDEKHKYPQASSLYLNFNLANFVQLKFYHFSE